MKTTSLSSDVDVTRHDVTDDVIGNHLHPLMQQRSSGIRRQRVLLVENSDVDVTEHLDQNVDDNNVTSSSDVLYSIRDLLDARLRSDARLRHQTDKNRQMMNEWIVAAAVIDRICFIVFGLCFFVGTVIIFALAASMAHM